MTHLSAGHVLVLYVYIVCANVSVECTAKMSIFGWCVCVCVCVCVCYVVKLTHLYTGDEEQGKRKYFGLGYSVVVSFDLY